MTRPAMIALTALTTGAAHAECPATATTTAGLVAAVSNGADGDTVLVAPGVYELAAPLTPRPGMTIVGSGAGVTTIRNAPSWVAGNAGLPDNAVDHTSVDRNAYLIDLGTGTTGVTISHVTLTGPTLHGAIYGNNADGLIVSFCELRDFLWSSIRVFRVNDGAIHDNEFVNAGGRAAVTSGVTGGAIFSTFHTATDIYNNRIRRTPDHASNVFGVKGRKFNDTRIYDNTIEVSFSIELPFENDDGVEIFGNYLGGVVSIPKFAGGPAAALGESFEIHHNYFTRTYSIEGPRNGLEVHRNLFDCSPDDDGGNLVSTFGGAGSPATPGPTAFHNNNVRNPGRGVFWSGPIYNGAAFYNNHVITNTTATPRTEGLFGFRLDANNDGDTPDLATLAIRDNIIEMNGLARPLIRNGGGADLGDIAVENNTLANVSDAGAYANPDTGAPRGPIDPLRFRVGVDGEFTVDGFTISATPACPGDVDGDGDTDVFDFSSLAAAFGATPRCPQWEDDADVNGDRTIDVFDFGELASGFGCDLDAP
jgi:hypothetical protein